MDAPLVWYREKGDYQKKLATLLTEVHRGSEVPSVIAGDLLLFLEDPVGLLCYKSENYSRKLHFEACIQKGQRLLSRWLNDEIISISTSKRIC